MRTSGSLLTEISKLKPGDHLCCIYETEEEHRALLTPYLRQGLERNEKVVYIVDARTGEAVLDYLRQSGLDTRPFLDKGQLVILSVADAYMREGAFIPDRMISFLRQETDRTVGEGYEALRVTGEMSWALRRLPGSNHLIEYESKLNSFLPGSRCLALCQYDKRRFPPELLLQVLATHPIAVIGTETFENVHYVSPKVFLAHDFSTAILGHWIEGLRIRRRVKAGEDALRESEGRFRAIFENSMDGILVTVPDGDILAANPTACQMLGRSEGEVCKAGRTGVVDPSDPRLPVLLEERARKGMCHGELTFVRRDGTKFPVDISSRLYKDRYGNPRTSMVFRDITERKKAEEKQRASDREVSESQRVAHVGSWDWDAAADSIRWSDEYYRIYSIDPDLPTSNYIEHLKIYTPECRERLDAAVKRAMQTGEGYELDLELADRAGPTRWICARGEAKRDPGGRIVGLRGTAQDITERKLLENQFLQAQKMEAVGRLAGGIAHDFNNLLTVTTGYCDLALARIGPMDPLRRDLEEIRKASDRCAALTRQILAFSRKQILVPKVINLGDVVADRDKMLRRLIGEDIDLVSVWGKDLWNVKADPGQIEQVIVNLAVNARDAMTRGGKLTIETANVVLDKMYARGHQYVSPGSYVMLAVSDTGCGMDEGMLPRIFEPFFTTKEKGKGTGLGLSTVYGIVKQSGGYINVYSEPGIGTTFKMYFPSVEESVTGISGAAALPSEELRGSETILVVEDEEPVRQMVREILEQYGYTVLEAGSGGEAVDLCSRHPGTIHLMLTDVVMPGINGVELSKRLAPMQPEMKVLFMSGYTANAIAHQGVLDPGVSFIHKPFSISSLAHKVREVLGSGAGPCHTDPGA